MKTILIALALTIASDVQAGQKCYADGCRFENTLQQCRDAVNDLSFINAYEEQCSSRISLEYNLGVFKLQECTKQVSLNELRLAIARDKENLAQIRYQLNDPYFCAKDDVVKEYHDALMRFAQFNAGH